jgi:N6-L-threonylcarbamoyladenine synthase
LYRLLDYNTSAIYVKNPSLEKFTIKKYNTVAMNKHASKILAIETSCDETAAAVLVNGRIKSSVIASQAKLHSKYGGVVPEVAAREHIPAIIPVINLALKKARLKLEDINSIAVTYGPGLTTSLAVGLDAAKALAFSANKPLYPINHMEAHIYANFVESNIKFPGLILVVSGGHTMLVWMQGHGQYKILGETIDDAAGEAFDKTAKLLGLGYPGGPALSKRAKTGNPNAFNFPRPLLNQKNLNFSFSGLKTAVLYEFIKHKKPNKQLIDDMAASVQRAIIDSLIGKLEKAIIEYRPKTLMLGGGVAANELLRSEFFNISKKMHISCSIPKYEYCTDNAAMIGLAAYHGIVSGGAKQNRFPDAASSVNL